MFRRAMRKLIGRALLVGGAVVVGRWAFGAIARSLASPHTAAALQAGRELYSEQRRVLIIAYRFQEVEHYLGGTLQLLRGGGSQVAVALLAGDDASQQSQVVTDGQMQDAVKSSGDFNIYRLNLAGESGNRTVFDALKELVTHLKPDVVLVNDPESSGFHPDLNQDAAADVVLDLVQAGELANARIYFYGSHDANVLIDTSDLALSKRGHTEALCRIV